MARRGRGGGGGRGRPVAAARSLTAWLTCGYLWAALTPLVVGLARRYPLSGPEWRRSAAAHAAAGVAVTFLRLTMADRFGHPFVDDTFGAASLTPVGPHAGALLP